jgi:hypothetical protein
MRMLWTPGPLFSLERWFKLSATWSRATMQWAKENGFKISCCYPKPETYFTRRTDSVTK